MTNDIASSGVIADIARKLRCSEGHFHRAFKRHTGKTPIVYLSQLRIDHAMHLLKNTDLNMSAIANQVGFPDQFYFSRVFRKLHGQSPKDFRERLRWNNE